MAEASSELDRVSPGTTPAAVPERAQDPHVIADQTLAAGETLADAPFAAHTVGAEPTTHDPIVASNIFSVPDGRGAGPTPDPTSDPTSVPTSVPTSDPGFARQSLPAPPVEGEIEGELMPEMYPGDDSGAHSGADPGAHSSVHSSVHHSVHPDAMAPVAATAFAAGADPGSALEVVPPLQSAEAAIAVPEHRVELEDPAAAMLRRLGIFRDELIAWFKTLASAAVYATLIVTFGFQVARVEGLSMAPTLADQDRLIVNKFAYRIGAPRRGDIVMLYYPLNPDKSFVKRVIAEEGDTVRIVDGRVYVNDVPMRDDFVPPEYRSHDDFGPTVIPEGYYFVMGDHRNNSSDSRHWGFVPKKYIIGKVQLRWWPIPTAHMF